MHVIPVTQRIFFAPYSASNTTVVCLYAQCGRQLNESEIIRMNRYEYGQLAEGMWGVEPTVLHVARALNELGLDGALRQILSFVSSDEEQQVFRICMNERRKRAASEIAAPGSYYHTKGGYGFHLFSSTEVEPSAPPRNFVLALDKKNASETGPLVVVPRRLPGPCSSPQTGAKNRVELGGKPMYREVFVCSSDEEENTRAALTELHMLLRFHHPGLPQIYAYAYDETLCSQGIIRLELYMPWYELGSVTQWIRSTKPGDWTTHCRIHALYTLAQTLSFMHNNETRTDFGFHRNLSASTVMLYSQCQFILTDCTKAMILNIRSDERRAESGGDGEDSRQTWTMNTILACQREDVMGFAQLCLEIWSHHLWEDSDYTIQLSSMTKEEKADCVSTYSIEIAIFELHIFSSYFSQSARNSLTSTHTPLAFTHYPLVKTRNSSVTTRSSLAFTD
ncbi:unnamed protein product [Echinostoma caproni]|uniref:Protein kinase domain-containing protein n=1 Tax=Echinostoma caproni TaxID=27848 RepID=A0A183AE40_9TREM|nr:unnamed protein product [Echinostoma caproni]